MPLLTFTDRGIYCARANVYLDPWKPVDRALISHGHSDHARWGHEHYLSTRRTAAIMRHRLGDINVESVGFGESRAINGVTFSFHPAGHIIGSAQIRCEYKGEVWCFSGDYKLQADHISEPYEPVRCHSFITESTFGLPIYRWRPQEEVVGEINDWWRANKAEGKTTLITGYSLGKAQRILHHLDTDLGTIYTHGAIDNMNQVLETQGVKLPPTVRVTKEVDKRDYPGNLVIAPPGAIDGAWARKFSDSSKGIASGWMGLRGARRRRAVDRGFVLSDHCDWAALNTAIEATGCTQVFVTHGYTAVFSKWLREQGYDAHVVSTEYEGESSEIGEGASVKEEVAADAAVE